MFRRTTENPSGLGGAMKDRCATVRIDGVTSGWIQDKPALTNVTLQIDGPGLVNVSGPNGAGKSTLVELISGYMRPWEGSVTLNGLPAHDGAARALRRICRTAPALFGLLTVRDHLVLSARSARIDPATQIARAEEFGLGPWLDENAGTLSSGTAKKLWYIFCTAGDFSLLVLDEPFNTLDAETVDKVVAEIGAWSTDRTIVLVAHLPPVGLHVTQTITLAVPAPHGAT